MSEEREVEDEGIFEVVGVVGIFAGGAGGETRGAMVAGREEGAPVVVVDAGRGAKGAAPLLMYRCWRPCNSFSTSIAKWNKR